MVKYSKETIQQAEKTAKIEALLETVEECLTELRRLDTPHERIIMFIEEMRSRLQFAPVLKNPLFNRNK